MSRKFVFVYVRVLSEYIYTAAVAGSICESFRRRGGASLPASRPSRIQGDYIPKSWSFGYGLLKFVYTFLYRFAEFFFFETLHSTTDVHVNLLRFGQISKSTAAFNGEDRYGFGRLHITV